MTNRNEKTTLTEVDLRHFHGTEHYWCTGIPFHPFVYTDGVRHVAEKGSAYWLLDLIGSWQFEKVVKHDKALQDIQFWTLTVNDDQSAEAICERDQGDIAVRQKLEYTDFPLSKIRFYLQHMWAYWAAPKHPNRDPSENGILLLPSEY